MRKAVQRVFLLGLGWMLFVTGAIITPLPPPFAFGFILLLIGLAILSSQSKTFRRGVQYMRHRYPGLSKRLEAVKPRAPQAVKRFIHVTAPLALERLHRLRQRRRTANVMVTGAAD